MRHQDVTDKIINAFYKVYNKLGYGFLERVYENAMCIELTQMGLKVEKQKRSFVYYEGHIVGEYFADLTVEDAVICELKTSEAISPENESQLLNYLKATTFEVGLLSNFGKRPEIKRKVYDTEKKT